MSKLMDLIHQAGFTGAGANTMYGIVMAESGGDAHAHNGNAGTGDNSYGLAQINMLGSMGPARLKQYGLSSNDDLFDPLTNLKVAFKLSGGGSNFSAWTTYTRGTYKKYVGQGDAVVTTSSSAGHGGNPIAASSGLSSEDYQTALGTLGGLLNTVPELKSILDQAVAGSWTSAKFQQSVQKSSWYKTHNEATRQLLALQVADPAQYKAQIDSASRHISGLARQLGVNLSTHDLNALALQDLMGSWDDQALQHALGSHYDRTKNPTGQAAQYYQQAAQIYGQYGQATSYGQLQYITQQMIAGNTTIDTYKQDAINKAKAMFPGLTTQLDSGLTVADAAQPYQQSMAQILEIDPASIKLSDPLVKKALQGTVDSLNAKGKPQDYLTTPLWQFEQQLRSDPRWEHTNNAKDQMSTALLNVGHAFGFGPTSGG